MTEPLVNTQAEFPPHATDARRKRHALRSVAAKHGYGRVKRCGRKRVSETVSIRNYDGRCVEHGYETCGSIWSCPVCALKIQRERQEEVRAAILEWHHRGGAVYMMAFTAPHYRGQGLSGLRGRIGGGWRKMLSGAPWKRLRSRYGVFGFVKGFEVTYGHRNGWHPHIHVLLFLERELSDEEAAQLRIALFTRWDAIVQREGSNPCNPDVFKLERAHTPEAAGDYVAKHGSDYEITHLHTKAGRNGSMTPWDLLDRAAAGWVEAGKRYAEYSRAMFGARQLTWSHGLKDALGITDKSDEQIASEETGEVVAILDGKEADQVKRAGRWVDLLEAAEAGGQIAVDAFLANMNLGRRSDDLREFRRAYFGEVDDEGYRVRSFDRGRNRSSENTASTQAGKGGYSRAA